MTYGSTPASVNGRTIAAAAVSKPLPVFRSRKRGAGSCKPARHDSRGLVEARPEVSGLEAFQEMFVAHRQRFVAMAYRILRNTDDAEDAVQNAFVSGYLHLRSFEGRSALTTWFTRIVLNAALMIRRKRKSSWNNPQPETGTLDNASYVQGIPAPQPNPETVCAERETFEFINEALGKMKPTLRQAFTMTYYEEMSGREACALLGVSTGTFKARLFRAKRQLLNHAQRALVAPARKATPPSTSPERRALRHPAAGPSGRPTMETA